MSWLLKIVAAAPVHDAKVVVDVAAFLDSSQDVFGARGSVLGVRPRRLAPGERMRRRARGSPCLDPARGSPSAGH